MTDAETHDALDDQRERLNEALRAYGASYSELAREFAASEGLHSTDAVALIEILAAEERGTPLTPARLSDRIGLTAGATSTLLNRLEAAGHVVRSRGHADRRMVTLHSTPNVQTIADDFFHPLGDRIAAVMAKHPPALLEQFETLLGELRGAMEAYIADTTTRRENDEGQKR
ncbi:MarR family winged helix-turn-helix transcriptional regulator [Leifsonia aquatica]|uniref:Transcriptional regulator, MarR family n=2 Tax=Leifsonia aquatica TaxID=144185 RepID=U2R2B1_LEIAQ|nr:helix-turn-helix domain-containing protein [Leifsonia aquatica]ERK69405.1 transcriptional regulator, MarR family [Leifsonia aquatica ATCC 14665]MBB2965624.1 DNA-binding MarR family transcriptional regulator [Leifsonia aquatica]